MPQNPLCNPGQVLGTGCLPGSPNAMEMKAGGAPSLLLVSPSSPVLEGKSPLGSQWAPQGSQANCGNRGASKGELDWEGAAGWPSRPCAGPVGPGQRPPQRAPLGVRQCRTPQSQTAPQQAPGLLPCAPG